MSVLRALHALSPPPLEFLPCPVCGGPDFREQFGPIRRCADCGLGMVNPPLPFRGEDENEAYFVEDYLRRAPGERSWVAGRAPCAPGTDRALVFIARRTPPAGCRLRAGFHAPGSARRGLAPFRGRDFRICGALRRAKDRMSGALRHARVGGVFFR